MLRRAASLFSTPRHHQLGSAAGTPSSSRLRPSAPRSTTPSAPAAPSGSLRGVGGRHPARRRCRKCAERRPRDVEEMPAPSATARETRVPGGPPGPAVRPGAGARTVSGEPVEIPGERRMHVDRAAFLRALQGPTVVGGNVEEISPRADPFPPRGEGTALVSAQVSVGRTPTLRLGTLTRAPGRQRRRGEARRSPAPPWRVGGTGGRSGSRRPPRGRPRREQRRGRRLRACS